MTSFTTSLHLAARKALLLAVLVTAAAGLAAPKAVMAAGQASSEGPEANLPYLFAVFIVTWGLFFAFAAYMSLRRRALEREIEALRSTLGEGGTED